MELFDANIERLERALDLRTRNQNLIASNLANIDTPGYQARRLDFAASMERALEGGDPNPVIGLSPEPAVSLDGNNVDLDRELAEMGRNRTMYQLTAQILAARFRQLATVFDHTQ